MGILKRVLGDYFSRHHREHGRREVAASLAIALVLAAAAFVGIAWAAGFGEVAALVAQPNWLWFPIALGGFAASIVGYTVAYRELAHADEGPHMPVRHAGTLVATGFGLLIPRGGFALDHEAMLDAGLPRREAKVRVRRLGLLEYAILAPAAFAAALFLLVDGVPDRTGIQLSWIVGVPVGACVTLLLLRHRAWLRKGGAVRKGIAGFLDAVARLAHLFWPPRKESVGAAGGMALYWAGDIFVLWACLAAFTQDGRPPVTALILGYATGYALSRRTLPFAGAGAVEALLPFALTWVGVALPAALLSVFSYRIFNLWLPAISGTPGLLALKRRHADG